MAQAGTAPEPTRSRDSLREKNQNGSPPNLGAQQSILGAFGRRPRASDGSVEQAAASGAHHPRRSGAFAARSQVRRKLPLRLTHASARCRRSCCRSCTTSYTWLPLSKRRYQRSGEFCAYVNVFIGFDSRLQLVVQSGLGGPPVRRDHGDKIVSARRPCARAVV